MKRNIEKKGGKSLATPVYIGPHDRNTQDRVWLLSHSIFCYSVFYV